MTPQPSPPFRRRVFYIAGYDPRSVRTYARMWRRAVEARPGGSMGRRWQDRLAFSSWPLEISAEGQTVETELTLWHWNDLVSARMAESLPLFLLRMARDCLNFIRTGWFRRIWQADRTMFLCTIYPYWAMAAVTLLTGLVAFALSLWFVPSLLGAGLATAALLFAALLLFRAVDGRHFVFWLGSYFSFCREVAEGRALDMRIRREACVEEIRSALSDTELDEILIVGHSAGAPQAALILDEVLKARTASPGGPALAFLTLGHNMGAVSLHPAAKALRSALARLSRRVDICWVDISSPRDWISFSMLDPTIAADMPEPEGKLWPRVLTVKFTKAVAREALSEARFSLIAQHFLFFAPASGGAKWDWVGVIGSPTLLRDRYKAARQHSRAARMRGK